MDFAKWKDARINAQANANYWNAPMYAFPQWDGRIAVESDYPKSGVEFETFKPSAESEGQ